MTNATMRVGTSHARWGVILAGGDGKRLLPLTRKLTGDERPKQFCAVSGRKTLLEQTLERVAGVVSHEKTLLVLTKEHEPFFGAQMSGMSRSQLLVQPSNKGTSPALLYSLMRVRSIDASAQVAFFPSDHYVSKPRRFNEHIRLAFDLSEEYPTSVVLLGIEPTMPEVSYGWIEPGVPSHNGFSHSFSSVIRFWEKPSISQAIQLYRRHCLWNSFIMVGRVEAFLGMIRESIPDLQITFESIQHHLSRTVEKEALAEIYSNISSSSFSADVLTSNAKRLLVLRSSGFEWTDLGEPTRVLQLYERKGVKSEEEYCILQRINA